MSLVRDHSDWIRRCEVGQIDDRQRVILEMVLAACDPKSIFTRQVSGNQTAIAAVAHAHSALESRARPHRKKGQPFASAVLDLITVALDTLESLKLIVAPQILDPAITVLATVSARGDAGLNQASDCHGAAVLLAAHVGTVHTVVADHFMAAWHGKTSRDADRRLAFEMAALCVMEGREHSELAQDLRTALGHGAFDVATVQAVLRPPVQAFKVAVIVEGTSRLHGAEGLMSPASALATIEPEASIPSDWGPATTAVKMLTERSEDLSRGSDFWVGTSARRHVVLTCMVDARDVGGAALNGRQQISEFLDQYVAGQRVSEIRMRPETVAYDPGSGRVLALAVPAMGSGVARPLTTEWPVALRESLRTAHIARATEAPMTAAGLCWAALEAMEVKSNATTTLSEALSLVALRQQVLDVHHRTRIEVAATARHARDRYRAATQTFHRLSAQATAAEAPKSKDLHELADLAQTEAAVRQDEKELAAEAEKAWATVDAWTGVGADGKLRDLDRWLDALADNAGPDPVLGAASDAVGAIAEQLGGEAGTRLREWRALVADAPALAKWIESVAAGWKTDLDWLYSLRNTALHDGRFQSPTAMMDVHAGRALVDLTLEMLGNWYEHATQAGSAAQIPTAIGVIEHIGRRQQGVIALLRGGTRAGLNVTHLTSPTSTGLDRV